MLQNYHLDLLREQRKHMNYAPIVIYTDGAFMRVSENGGYGFIISEPFYHEGYGIVFNTTNQRMEITAVIYALVYVTVTYGIDNDITIYSDSEYVVNTINKWLSHWIELGRLNEKHPNRVKNPDLWLSYIRFSEYQRSVKAVWVKGHSGVPLNERADVLAGTLLRKEPLVNMNIGLFADS